MRGPLSPPYLRLVFVAHALTLTLPLTAAAPRRRPADNGSITLWDYATGKPFQHIKDIPHPGSLDAESGVFVSTFDKTGTRLITGGADKTIKVRAPLPFPLLSLAERLCCRCA